MASSAKDIQLRELKDTILQLNTMVSEQTELIKSLRLMIDAKSSREKALQEQVDYLTQKLFGSSSERRSNDISGQQNLFDEAEIEQDPSLLEEETVIREHTRKKKAAHDDLFKGLRVEKVVLPHPEEEQVCPVCGTQMFLIGEGYVPAQDIYFAFSGGEEVNGLGAVHIVDWFEANHITPALVVDEGGAVVEDVFPGVKQPCGLIGIAEKGMLNVEYKVKSGGGHASAPKPHSPLVALSEACTKIESHPFKAHVTKPVAEMFDTLGRYSNFTYRMIFANLWLFGDVLDSICRKSGGELNALMRTTVAFTQAKGSAGRNVIPPEAAFISNLRLNPEDTMDSALAYLKETINDPAVEITKLEGMNPSRISETNCPAWDKVASAVAGTWKGCLVAPYLMVQCSDSRHYGRISDHVYRFSAMDLTAEERGTLHGNNERIRVETVGRAVEFYVRLMRQC